MPNSRKTRSASASTSAPKQRAAVSEVVPPTALLLTLMAGLSCSKNSVTGVTQHLHEQSQSEALKCTRSFTGAEACWNLQRSALSVQQQPCSKTMACSKLPVSRLLCGGSSSIPFEEEIH